MNAVSAMASPWRPDEYGAPVLASLGLHVLVVVLLVSNLSFCEQQVLLPPVPAHVKAVLLERAPPRRALEERPAAKDIVIPEIVVPPPLKLPPAPAAAPLPPPKNVEKTLARRAPAKAQPAPPVQEKPRLPPPPDFSAMLAQEEKTLAQREALRRDAAQQSQQEVNVRAAQNQKVVEEYTALIAAEIQRRWLRPASVRAGMFAEFRITLLPGGEVRDVRLAKSSGDPAFDQSAENAIRLAGRLPVPADPAVFNAGFRQFTFRFRPEDSKQ